MDRAELRGGVLALAGVVLLGLLVASATPGLPGELLVQSLRFHLVAAGLALVAAAMMLGARWRGLAVLLPVLAGLGHGALLLREFHVHERPAGEPAAQLRLLSFNVLSGNPRAAELVDAILADPPDVAVIMETPGIRAHLGKLAEALPYRVGCEDSRTCDISLHSRFPIEEGQIRTMPPFGNERLVVGRVRVDGQSVTIAGTHLSKPYFDQASWIELAHLGQVLEGVEGPLVLAGDFNSAPWTEPMARLAGRLELAAGPWPPATWPVRLGPLGVPIDNVFTSGAARLLALESGDSHGSNHRPLRAVIGLYGER